MLEKEKFRLYELDKKKRQDVISIKLNPKERTALEQDKQTLQQEKDATVIKQLVLIGRKVIHSSPEGIFFKTVLENIRKNKRIGIDFVEAKKQQK